MNPPGKVGRKQFRQFWDHDNATRSSLIPFLGNWPLLGGVLTANSAQLLVTFSYYFYNNVLTSMLAAAEYSSYGVDRKSLRVTWPVKGSQQRSTYWLSVPYRYCIPIMVLYMILHWLVSESIFYVVFTPYDWNDQPVYNRTYTSLALSPLPIILALIVGFLMVSILIALSFRRLKSRIPLAGSCSAAISAACHPPTDDYTDTAALRELIWGETSPPPDWDAGQTGKDHKGHCTFTSLNDVQPPSTEKSYA